MSTKKIVSLCVVATFVVGFVGHFFFPAVTQPYGQFAVVCRLDIYNGTTFGYSTLMFDSDQKHCTTQYVWKLYGFQVNTNPFFSDSAPAGNAPAK